jgi:hypothetical protein
MSLLLLVDLDETWNGMCLPNITFHGNPLGGSRIVPEVQTDRQSDFNRRWTRNVTSAEANILITVDTNVFSKSSRCQEMLNISF